LHIIKAERFVYHQPTGLYIINSEGIAYHHGVAVYTIRSLSAVWNHGVAVYRTATLVAASVDIAKQLGGQFEPNERKVNEKRVACATRFSFVLIQQFRTLI
jgi:hypothetical protein